MPRTRLLSRRPLMRRQFRRPRWRDAGGGTSHPGGTGTRGRKQRRLDTWPARGGGAAGAAAAAAPGASPEGTGARHRRHVIRLQAYQSSLRGHRPVKSLMPLSPKQLAVGRARRRPSPVGSSGKIGAERLRSEAAAAPVSARLLAHELAAQARGRVSGDFDRHQRASPAPWRPLGWGSTDETQEGSKRPQTSARNCLMEHFSQNTPKTTWLR
jgi:hypothetical protein